MGYFGRRHSVWGGSSTAPPRPETWIVRGHAAAAPARRPVVFSRRRFALGISTWHPAAGPRPALDVKTHTVATPSPGLASAALTSFVRRPNARAGVAPVRETAYASDCATTTAEPVPAPSPRRGETARSATKTSADNTLADPSILPGEYRPGKRLIGSPKAKRRFQRMPDEQGRKRFPEPEPCFSATRGALK